MFKKISIIYLIVFMFSTSLFPATKLIVRKPYHKKVNYPKAQNKPDWISGISREYPENKYLISIGKANSLRIAEENARMNMSELFNVEIEVKQEDGGVATITSTESLMVGLELKSYWVDENGIYYVLAIINREKASELLRKKIQKINNYIEYLMNSSEKSKSNLPYAVKLKKILNKIKLREMYNLEFRVVSSNKKGVISKYSKLDILKLLKETSESTVKQ